MVIVMHAGANQLYIDAVIAKVKELGYTPHPIRGTERTVVAAIGDERGKYELQRLESMQGVEKVVPILEPYKLSGREYRSVERTAVHVGDVEIGGNRLVLMAGPCSVESREQILETAEVVKESGAQILRGGAFKPRTSPYSFQGLGEEGLGYLAEARDKTGLLIITELMDSQDLKLVEQYTDIIQIGARNMQNYGLLSRLRETKKPVMVKRGMMSKIDELLLSAEYILSSGNYNVILCERGIRTFETATRNTFDLNAIPVIKKMSHLPIIADPSHGTGHWEYVNPMAKAAVAAGADGLMIEVHPHPEQALSDGAQSLRPDKFLKLVQEFKPFIEASGRTF
ncbi:3-deoxy-7-phosphoheptulonate synthase [Candidatus Poribacteria bacterium]|nr:3-deoxy-7-phosphoheptulonate synthase [Candidatus Poribacteria bacterium]